jgi:hypothetical protein
MRWAIEYYEQANGAQPAETFEDALKRDHPKLGGKMRRVLVGILEHGRKLGGGLIEPMHDYPGLWEARAISESWLAREFFAWDGNTAILLHGYVKRTGQKASKPDMNSAQAYWQDYIKMHRVSPEVSEEPQQLSASTGETQTGQEATGREQAPTQSGVRKREKEQSR